MIRSIERVSTCREFGVRSRLDWLPWFVRKVYQTFPERLRKLYAYWRPLRIFIRPFCYTDLLIASGLYERELKNMITCGQGDIVFDIGAHIGYYTLKFSRMVGKTGKVISVEPDPANLRVLLLNVAFNNLDNVIIVNSALAEYVGVAKLLSAPDPGNSTILGARLKRRNLKQINVPCNTLDELIAELSLDRPISLIKIDTEGSELKILRGGVKALTRTKRLIIEVSFENARDVEQLLQTIGFQCRVVKMHPSNLFYVLLAERSGITLAV